MPTATRRALVAAFNTFVATTAVQSIALADAQLRDRLHLHTQLVGTFAQVARELQTAAARVETVRRHSDAVLDALDAATRQQACRAAHLARRACLTTPVGLVSVF